MTADRLLTFEVDHGHLEDADGEREAEGEIDDPPVLWGDMRHLKRISRAR